MTTGQQRVAPLFHMCPAVLENMQGIEAHLEGISIGLEEWLEDDDRFEIAEDKGLDANVRESLGYYYGYIIGALDAWSAATKWGQSDRQMLTTADLVAAYRAHMQSPMQETVS